MQCTCLLWLFSKEILLLLLGQYLKLTTITLPLLAFVLVTGNHSTEVSFVSIFVPLSYTAYLSYWLAYTEWVRILPICAQYQFYLIKTSFLIPSCSQKMSFILWIIRYFCIFPILYTLHLVQGFTCLLPVLSWLFYLWREGLCLHCHVMLPNQCSLTL